MTAHEITIYESVESATKKSAWCASHKYDGVFDSTDPLPDEAQSDPVGYCASHYPDAEIIESTTVDVW